MHNTLHQHFGLSNLEISNETLAVCFAVSPTWLSDNTKVCQNGFCTSFHSSRLNLLSFALKGALSFQGTAMAQLMATEEWEERITKSHI
eukprot:542494-Amphidinium_carterae.1